MPAINDVAHCYASEHGGDVDHDQSECGDAARCAQRFGVRGEIDGGNEVAETLEYIAELEKEECFVPEEREIKALVVGGLWNGKARLE